MPSPRERILARLRQSSDVTPRAENPVQESVEEAEQAWLKQQPPLGDLAERFVLEQEAVGGQVRRVAGWSALPDLVPPWLAELGVQSIVMGREPRLDALRDALSSDGRFTLRIYDRPLEDQRDVLFGSDCGITTSLGGLAETGSVILVPSGVEPRLLSLAPEVHLAVVERAALHPRLADFIASGVYQSDVPTNLVLVSGASRTADIELTLAMGVHGPKVFAVALLD